MATLTLTVGATADDARVNDLGYDNTETAMQVGGANTTTGNYGQGWRFLNVTLGGSDTINSAILKLMKSTTQFSNQVNRWTFAAEDNAATFSSGSPPGLRAIVASPVADTNNLNETDTTVYNFPRSAPNQVTLGARLASVTARGGWASGNAVAIVNNSKQDASANTTSARKLFHTWDSATGSSEPQLVIDYTAAAAKAPPPFFRPQRAIYRTRRF